MQAQEKSTKIEAILKSFQKGASRAVACEAADIDPSTFWHWCDKAPALKKRVRDVRTARVQVVEDALYVNAISGGQFGKGVVAAQIFILCNQAPEKWRNVQNIAVTHRVEDLPLSELVSKLPRGQRRFADLGLGQEEN